ncbi:MFS transporter [Amycolatopsis sp. GM8]|uniref:MFS transporter n=1 Tax=Amycolatopsis sp. GM8 TaxID=2896530 RepID=UPI001F354801|nr:MFS transporter [Amycolatopsis sp. GM8]
MTAVARAGTSRTSGGVTPVLAFTGIVVSITQTLVVPLLATLPALLRTSASNATWVITITLLTGAVATPVLGRLGDMFGKRRMLLVALATLVAGSLLCAFSSSLLPMMIGRALQGCSIGAIPLGISIMRDELPADRLGSAMGLMSSSLGIGAALGLPAAALVAEHLDWHTLFFGAAGLGVVALVLVVAVVPESSVRSPGRFDIPGAIGLSVGLVALLVAISKGSDWGWGSTTTLGFLAAAVLVFLLWGVLELRTAEPLVDLRATARRQVLLTNLASILVGFALYSTQLVPPQLLQLPAATGYGLGQSMLVAGLCVAPTGFLMMAVSPVAARVIKRSGPKTSLMLGVAVLGAAYLAGLWMLGEAWQVAVFAAIAGAGVGLAYSSMPALIIDAVPVSETAAANGLNTLMRSIGTSSSSAVVGMVLSHMTTRFGSSSVPSLAGFRTALLIAAGGCVVALVVAAFVPGRRRAQPVTTTVSTGVTGVVSGPGGAVAAAVVVATDAHGDVAGRVEAGRDGTFELAGLPPGRYTLAASAAGHRPAAHTVDVADGPPARQDVVLGGGGTVRVAVRATDDSALAGAKVTLLDRAGNAVAAGVTGGDGQYRFADLADNRYTVVASGYAPVATKVSLSAGDRFDCDFTLTHD